MQSLNGFGDVIVALAHTLITADLGVLALALLHQSLQLCVIALRDSLRLHLDNQVAAGAANALPDVDDSLFQSADAQALV